ncbi:MAG TPA: PDZ domain-containing protein [Micromonosporaceae bacterium]|nr:PDZ domain-containing protein [Micromonosporaceae bacterium]
MQRRGATVLIGAVLVALLAWGVSAAPVPYVLLGPGPTVDTLGTADGKDVIAVRKARATDSAGQLRLVTVSVRSNDVNLIDAVRGWFSGRTAVVPRELVYPPGRTAEEVDQENAKQFEASQTSAETAALRRLGYPVEVTVTEVAEGSPAQAALRAGDVVTSVDGQAVTSRVKLTELIRAKPVGTALSIGYRRGGQAATATVTTIAGDDGAPRIGIVADQRQPHPFELTIELDEIGGPSAGLMFALGIVDTLDPADLTGGRILAGTGTIDDEGRVGAIGGIPQKLIAAKEARAVAFLTPADNCAEAAANAVPGLPLVSVASLDEALAALDALRAGRQPALCPAG